MSEIKLKPCPFCGGEAQVMRFPRCDRKYVVICGNELCYASIGNYSVTKEEAIQAWNTRKPMDAIVEALNDAGNQRVENAFGGREEWEAIAYRQGTRKAIEIVRKGGVE